MSRGRTPQRQRATVYAVEQRRIDGELESVTRGELGQVDLPADLRDVDAVHAVLVAAGHVPAPTEMSTYIHTSGGKLEGDFTVNRGGTGLPFLRVVTHGAVARSSAAIAAFVGPAPAVPLASREVPALGNAELLAIRARAELDGRALAAAIFDKRSRPASGRNAEIHVDEASLAAMLATAYECGAIGGRR